MKIFHLAALAAATALTLASLGVIDHNLPLEPSHTAAVPGVTTLAPVYVYPSSDALPASAGIGALSPQGRVMTVVDLAAVIVHPGDGIPGDDALASAVATPQAVLARVARKGAPLAAVRPVAADTVIK